MDPWIQVVGTNLILTSSLVKKQFVFSSIATMDINTGEISATIANQ